MAKFISNARGSAYETLDHLITAHDENILNSSLLQKGEDRVGQAVKLLNGYIHYLQKLSRTVKEPNETNASIPPFSSPSLCSPNETNASIPPFSHTP